MGGNTECYDQTDSCRSLTLERIYFPSAELPSLVETYRFTNTGSRNVVVEIPMSDAVINTAAEKGA